MSYSLTGVLAGSMLVLALAANPNDVRATILDRAAAHGAPGAKLVALADCETDLDPNRVGDQGELGVFQLHPRGKLLEFYERGYTNPTSVWQQADYVSQVVIEEGADAWVTCGRIAGLR